MNQTWSLCGKGWQRKVMLKTFLIKKYFFNNNFCSKEENFDKKWHKMCNTFVKIVLIINSQLIAQCLGTDSTTEETGIQWPNHDISTLKLLQIVHRHGDRNPTAFSPNDPYQSSEYWREGLGELTSAGKYRMYKLGQTLRKEYHNYLGDEYSPREVFP